MAQASLREQITWPSQVTTSLVVRAIILRDFGATRRKHISVAGKGMLA